MQPYIRSERMSAPKRDCGRQRKGGEGGRETEIRARERKRETTTRPCQIKPETKDIGLRSLPIPRHRSDKGAHFSHFEHSQRNTLAQTCGAVGLNYETMERRRVLQTNGTDRMVVSHPSATFSSARSSLNAVTSSSSRESTTVRCFCNPSIFKSSRKAARSSPSELPNRPVSVIKLRFFWVLRSDSDDESSNLKKATAARGTHAWFGSSARRYPSESYSLSSPSDASLSPDGGVDDEDAPPTPLLLSVCVDGHGLHIKTATIDGMTTRFNPLPASHAEPGSHVIEAFKSTWTQRVQTKIKKAVESLKCTISQHSRPLRTLPGRKCATCTPRSLEDYLLLQTRLSRVLSLAEQVLVGHATTLSKF